MSRHIDCCANRHSLAKAKSSLLTDANVLVGKSSYSRFQILAIVLSSVLGVLAIRDDFYKIADRYTDQSINLLLQIIG